MLYIINSSRFENLLTYTQYILPFGKFLPKVHYGVTTMFSSIIMIKECIASINHIINQKIKTALLTLEYNVNKNTIRQLTISVKFLTVANKLSIQKYVSTFIMPT